jgi:hypothetical protein
MTKCKRIFVYMENAPVQRDVIATGLHHAAPPILRSIIDHIDGIAIYPAGHRYTNYDLDRELAPLCSTLPSIPTLLCKVLHRYPVLGFGFTDLLPPRLLSPVIRRSSADILFTFVGADYSTLVRADRLATLTGKSSVFYLVDDFLAAMQISGTQSIDVAKAKIVAQDVLRRAKHVFTITEGLGDHFGESYGIVPTTLPLAFDPVPKPSSRAKKQIIYVGSVNFLYKDGLFDLFKSVDLIRRAKGEDLKIRLTVPAAIAAKQLGEMPPFVTSAPIETSDALSEEIGSSLFAFLPYSFASREKEMVSTSFPSKALEYFASARSIVVYGPDYGIATKLFREMAMPSVVSSCTELHDAILSHLHKWPDHSPLYRSYLATKHSLAAIRKTLCRDLTLDY